MWQIKGSCSIKIVKHLPGTVPLSLQLPSWAWCPDDLRLQLTGCQTWESPPGHRIYKRAGLPLSSGRGFQNLQRGEYKDDDTIFTAYQWCSIKQALPKRMDIANDQRWSSEKQNCDTLTNGGDDGPTEEEGIGKIPSGAEIRNASGIHTSLNCINYFLQRLVFSDYMDGGVRWSTYRELSYCSFGLYECQVAYIIAIRCFFLLFPPETCSI